MIGPDQCDGGMYVRAAQAILDPILDGHFAGVLAGDVAIPGDVLPMYSPVAGERIAVQYRLRGWRVIAGPDAMVFGKGKID